MFDPVFGASEAGTITFLLKNAATAGEQEDQRQQEERPATEHTAKVHTQRFVDWRIVLECSQIRFSYFWPAAYELDVSHGQVLVFHQGPAE